MLNSKCLFICLPSFIQSLTQKSNSLLIFEKTVIYNLTYQFFRKVMLNECISFDSLVVGLLSMRWQQAPKNNVHFQYFTNESFF